MKSRRSPLAAAAEGHAVGPVGEPRPKRDTGRRLRGSIAQQLGTEIVCGDYAPGAVLPSEIELSQAFNVSRSALREAMRALAAKGLVVSRTKTGTSVLPRARWNLLDPDVLAWAFARNPDPELVRSIFELRWVVEPAAARFAAERRSADDLVAMKAALDSMQVHTLATEQGRAADRDFHDAMLRATRNDAIVGLSASIGAAVHWTTHYKQRSGHVPRDPLPDHIAVYEAIAAGDAKAAASAMRALVDLALADTAALLDKA